MTHRGTDGEKSSSRRGGPGRVPNRLCIASKCYVTSRDVSCQVALEKSAPLAHGPPRIDRADLENLFALNADILHRLV